MSEGRKNVRLIVNECRRKNVECRRLNVNVEGSMSCENVEVEGCRPRKNVKCRRKNPECTLSEECRRKNVKCRRKNVIF